MSGEVFARELGAGPPLLLIAGGPGFDSLVFLPWLAPLAASARLVLVDLPGTGRSPAPGGVEALTHETWIAACEAVRERLAIERWSVLGHSYGGLVAMEYALSRPERVAGLVLCNAYPALDDGEAIVARLAAVASPGELAAALDLLTLAVDDDETFRARLVASLPGLAAGVGADTARALFARMQLSAAVYRHACSRLLPGSAVADRLGELRVPALVIGGADDPLAPPGTASRVLAAAIPHATLVLLQSCRHWAFVEAPVETLAALTTWLARPSQWHHPEMEAGTHER